MVGCSFKRTPPDPSMLSPLPSSKTPGQSRNSGLHYMDAQLTANSLTQPLTINGLPFDIFPSVCYKDLFEIESGQDTLIDSYKSGEGVANPLANSVRKKTMKLIRSSRR
jgi:hypothetical protein